MDGTYSKHWKDVEAVEVFPGIRRRELYKESSGRKALILELDPGAKWPIADLHDPGPEEVYVIEGTFSDGNCDYEAGCFLHSDVGTTHVPQSKAGCKLFVFFPEG
jgi:anti-sigma factor ChrR (cupin superfamily)